MIASITNPASTQANPAPLQDGQIAGPDSADPSTGVPSTTTRSSAASQVILADDGKIAPPVTDPADPGSPGTAVIPDIVATVPTDTVMAPPAGPSDTSNDGIRGRIDSITDEINELSGQETLSETEQLRLQELTQRRTELFTMLTNLMKQEHEARMAIIRNL